jgi:Amt family ammonium transporter
MARVGGDEFAVLLFDCPLTKAAEIADGLRRALRDFRFVWDDKSIDVGASIGVVRVAESSGDINDVLRAADVACRIAKEEGRNRIHLYQLDDLTVTRHHSEIGWVQRINRAIQHDRFVLYGQWIMPLARGRQLHPHCEVLVHLEEDDGIIAPIAFLSAAERYHLMPAVDRWVVSAVFRALRDLPRDSGVSFNVNLSGQTLCDAEFLPFVQRELRQSGMAASRICFEITETAAVTHMSRAVGLIGALREAGCSFALDDFGSGLSSFTYLKTMPVDFLKIDGAFVRNAPVDQTDLAMVSSINQVAHIMGIRTIAEYVETDDIRTTLESIGVDYGQGYALARPQPLAEILEEVAKGYPNIAHG